MFYIVKKKRGINMQNKTMSEIQRNNQTALAGHTIEALLIVLFYFYLFIVAKFPLSEICKNQLNIL